MDLETTIVISGVFILFLAVIVVIDCFQQLNIKKENEERIDIEAIAAAQSEPLPQYIPDEKCVVDLPDYENTKETPPEYQ
ncbi:hypothetical protein HDV06_005526 [Boothiomyces sp. JEL0866]|nr:hypothetical protein HDV06_005526 [Boothiomyces sp. JEL0866]